MVDKIFKYHKTTPDIQDDLTCKGLWTIHGLKDLGTIYIIHIHKQTQRWNPLELINILN